MLKNIALFLTLFVMMPTLQVVYDSAILPLVSEEIEEMEALELASDELEAAPAD